MNPFELSESERQRLDKLLIFKAIHGKTEDFDLFIRKCMISSYGDALIVDYLKSGGDSKTKGASGESILQMASFRGYSNIVEQLITFPYVNFANNYGITPLMLASAYGGVECVKLLLPVSDVNAKDEKGRTAADWAWFYGSGKPECAHAIKSFLAEQEAKEIEEEITTISSTSNRGAARL